MLILKIKQAECALADGRLDEAFDLATAEDIRSHRSGQDLAGKVVRAMVARGRAHLDADRLVQAGGDCDKAGRLGGNLPEVAGLRSAITAALLAKQQVQQRNAGAVAYARKQIDQGQLSLCQRLLDGVHDTQGHAAALMQDVNARRAIIESAVEKIGECLDRDDWETAVAELARVAQNKLSDSRLRELAAKTTKILTGRIQSAIVSGRLDLAASLMTRLATIGDRGLQTEQLQASLAQCRQVARHIELGQLHQAEEHLRRLASILPDADWIESTLKNLRQGAQAMEELRAGPFGLLPQSNESEKHLDDTQMLCPSAAPAVPRPQPATNSLPSKLLIQVDGIGSFLVLRQPRITVGPISSSRNCDLGLVAEPLTPAVSIERVDDDYFLRAGSGVTVNDRPTSGKLLASGDRIGLSARTRLNFRIPSAASNTAVLDLHAARTTRADIRHAILMDREIIIGPGPATHVRADDLPENIILHLRDGQLLCQGHGEMTIDDKPAGRSAAIPLNSHLKLGQLSFVVTQG